jgi:hypothetical protein
VAPSVMTRANATIAEMSIRQCVVVSDVSFGSLGYGDLGSQSSGVLSKTLALALGAQMTPTRVPP